MVKRPLQFSPAALLPRLALLLFLFASPALRAAPAPAAPVPLATRIDQLVEATFPGLVAAQQAAAEAEFDKKTPVTTTNATDVARLTARANHVEQFIFDKLKGNVGQFAGLFGNSAGEPQDVFYATADQALFFSNAGVLRGWLAPSAGNLAERCAKLEDPKALAEELYLSTLTRPPAEDELAVVKKFLEARPKEKPAVVQELAWGLLTSVEFRFKH